MNQFLDKVTQGAKDLTKSAQKQLEIAGLRSKAATLRRSTGKDYRMIGEIAFLAIQAGEEEAIAGRVAELVEVVRDKLAQADELDSKVLEINEEKVCPQCQKTSPMSALFCQSCGTKFEEILTADEDEDEEEEPTSYNCPDCGVTLSYGAGYCTNCGSKIGL